MSRLQWDEMENREYSTGVKCGVLYTAYTGSSEAYKGKSKYNAGVAWNGITAITETPGGAEANDNYADDIKYVSLRGAETFNQTIEAFMAPDAWDACDGMANGGDTLKGVLKIAQQSRLVFGTAHIVTVGNAEKKEDFGFEIHLAYNMTASPSEKAHNTINENPELNAFSWECTADPVPVKITGAEAASIGITKPTANVVIKATQKNGILKAGQYGGWDWNTATTDPTTTNILAGNVKAIYELVFGRDEVSSGGTVSVAGVNPTLPEPGVIYDILTSQSVVDAASYGVPS